MNPNEDELKKDYRNLSTIQDTLHSGEDSIDQIIALVLSKFKFGYGGYNGCIDEYSELKKDIETEISYLNEMNRLQGVVNKLQEVKNEPN